MSGDARIEGHHYCIYMPLGTAFETLLALNYNSFILMVETIIGVAIYSIEGGGYKVFDSHASNMYGNSYSEGTPHAYCWKYHPCIN